MTNVYSILGHNICKHLAVNLAIRPGAPQLQLPNRGQWSSRNGGIEDFERSHEIEAVHCQRIATTSSVPAAR